MCSLASLFRRLLLPLSQAHNSRSPTMQTHLHPAPQLRQLPPGRIHPALDPVALEVLLQLTLRDLLMSLPPKQLLWLRGWQESSPCSVLKWLLLLFTMQKPVWSVLHTSSD